METPNTALLRIGEWCVNPSSGEISRDGQAVRLEVRTTRLLLCLARHAGEVVSIDALLSDAWSGVVVGQDSVYQAIASLRRLLGDDAKAPKYIETVPRLGYRMVATVTPWEDQPQPTLLSDASRAADTEPSPRVIPAATTDGVRRRTANFSWVAGAGVICLIGLAAFVFVTNAPDHRPTAVSPWQPSNRLLCCRFPTSPKR